MATAVARQVNRRYDRIFFPVMTALIFATVFIGFSRTYYLAGLTSAPLPNVLIHIHGAIFTCWLILLAVQTGLVSAKRVDIHRRLGLWGFGLATLMVILGVLAATDALRRGFAPSGAGISPLTFYIVPITDMAVFTTLIFLGYRARRDPSAHKRWMILATIAILDAAIARWPFAFMRPGHLVSDLILFSFLFLLAGYDLLTMHRIHRATLWGSALIILVQEARIPFGMTKVWHSLAEMALGKF